MASKPTRFNRRMLIHDSDSNKVGTKGKENLNGKEFDFSVVTFNVLAQIYVRSESYPYVSHSNLRHKYRKQLLEEEFGQLNGDLLCLQEVDDLPFVESCLKKRGYKGVWLKRSGKKKDGCAIFWKTKLFNKISGVEVELNDLEERLNDSAYGRDNVGIILTLNPVNTSVSIVVATVHLTWNPTWPETKFQQSKEMIRRIIQANSEGNPVIFCGDFNSLPNSAVYKYITTGSINTNHKELVKGEFDWRNQNSKEEEIEGYEFDTIPIKFNSAYSNYLGKGREPLFTNYQQDFKGTLDYIFYQDSQNRIRLNSLLEIPPEEILGAQTGLPNFQFPSDHLSLKAGFSLLLPDQK